MGQRRTRSPAPASGANIRLWGGEFPNPQERPKKSLELMNLPLSWKRHPLWKWNGGVHFLTLPLSSFPLGELRKRAGSQLYHPSAHMMTHTRRGGAAWPAQNPARGRRPVCGVSRRRDPALELGPQQGEPLPSHSPEAPSEVGLAGVGGV